MSNNLTQQKENENSPVVKEVSNATSKLLVESNPIFPRGQICSNQNQKVTLESIDKIKQ